MLDILTNPFAHGHLYVALSRVTFYSNIRLICNEESVFENSPSIASITFNELKI